MKKASANTKRRRSRRTDERLINVALALHDGPAQHLIAAHYSLTEALSVIDHEPSAVKEILRAAETRLWQSIAEIRSIIAGLQGAITDDSEVVIFTLEQLTKELPSSHDVTIDYGGDREVTVKSSVAKALVRIGRELLNNTLAHAKANRVRVRLASYGEQVVLSVEDNGIGFDVEAVDKARKGFGLVSIRILAEQLGGRVTIHSKIGQDTRIAVELPRYGRP